MAALTGQASAGAASGLPAAQIVITGAPELVFDSSKDGCAGIDTPDLNPRAFRDASGQVVFAGLHFVNRLLRGPDLSHVKIDCQVALDSKENPDPAAFEGRYYLAGFWTDDGRNVAAIVHNEYHADHFGKCSAQGDIACWYNSLLAFRSQDGGRSFAKALPAIVAVAPFRQDVEQGRHRGFFQPSNIFGDGKYRYFFGSTTGWSGQNFGACLFRTSNPADSGSWRAYDGAGYTIKYANPYGPGPASAPAPCQTIAPFAFPVGAVVRLRSNGLWAAVFQASKNDGDFPVDGFYYATAKTLTGWSLPRLLLAGKTLYNGPCDSSGKVVSYPSLLDEQASGRNFDDTGSSPWLYYTELATKGCEFTGLRKLVRVKLEIKAARP